MSIGIIIGGISLYRSYALYEEEKEYNVLKGQIPDFGYDVKFAVTVDGQKSNEIPSRQKSADNSYYKVQVSCTNGTTVGEWDYNAWNVKLDDISDGSKCTLAFTGGMSKEEYQKYIEQGIATRRNTYRGKELTLNDAFWTSIQNGTFDDIYVGDYIVSPTSNKTNGPKDINKNTVIWLVADIDNYLGTGDPKLTQHHLTMIPAVPLIFAQMNTTDTTKGGYYGSKMVSGCNGEYEGNNIQNCGESILDEVYNKYIKPDFEDGNHIILYSNYLTSAMDNSASGAGWGTSESGTSSSWLLINNRKLDLMSEMSVYGGRMWSSSGFDTGIDNRQYAIFRLKPEFINSYELYRNDYWLKDVSSKASFVYTSQIGITGSREATKINGVRPRFLIG